MSKSKALAWEIENTCKSLGWNFGVNDDIFWITKKITPGDLDEFSQADREYYRIMRLMPVTRNGSMWGTDGGGVGGYSATKRGLFVMKMSGGSKHVLNQLAKLGS